MKLALFRQQQPPMSAFLRYEALVDEGIVFLKDQGGAFLAGWRFTGPDLDAAPDAELAYAAAHINRALLALGTGWMMNIDTVRKEVTGYITGSRFPEPTTRLIDEARRARYEARGGHYSSDYILIVTWWPPSEAASRADKFFVNDPRTRDQQYWLEQFKINLRQIEDSLSAVLRMERLGERALSGGGMQSDLLRHLHFCISGEDHPVRVPPVPFDLDVLLSQDFITGFAPRVGDNWIAVVTIEGFPAECWPQITEFLNRLPIDHCRWSTRFIFLDRADAEDALKKYRNLWKGARITLGDAMARKAGSTEPPEINMDAQHMADTAMEMLTGVQSGTIGAGYYTSVIVLMDRERARVMERADHVRKALSDHGFIGRAETLNAADAYIGSLPGNAVANVRRPILNTLNLAYLMPWTSVWPGHAHNPCPFYPAESPPLFLATTGGGHPLRVSLHYQDIGLTLIAGPMGGGKSCLINVIVASQFRYPGAQVFVLEIGYSSYVLCKAAGGGHYDIAGDVSKLSFCPLACVDDPNERLWASDWLEALAELQGIAVTPRHKEAIHKALLLFGNNTVHRTLTDFVATLQDHELRAAFNHYTLSGAMGSLLDADRDGLGDEDLQVFELGNLLKLGEKNSIPVLLYLFHRLEQRLEQGRPTLIPTDETALLFNHPTFVRAFTEWNVTIRKRNAALVISLTSVAQLLKSPIAGEIIENCKTKLFVPNPEAREDIMRPKYEALGLNERQINYISSARAKREYLLMHPDGCRLFDLELGAVELALCGASGKEDLRNVRRLIAEHGEDSWVPAWLRHKGLSDAADQWVQLKEQYRCLS